MSKDSSSARAKGKGQRAKLAPAQNGPSDNSDAGVSNSSVQTTRGELSPQPSALNPAVPWGPWVAVLYAVVVYFAAQILASLVLVLLPKVAGWDGRRISDWVNSSIAAQFFYVLMAEVLTFAAIWWFVHKRGTSLRTIGWRRPAWWNVLQALAGFAVYFVAYAVLLVVAQQLFHSLNVDQKQDLGFTNPTGAGGLLLTFLSLVILPPVVEETVFRGFVFTGIRTRVRPLYAALLTSVLFAVPHLLESGQSGSLLWVAGIDTFTLSLVLCYLRHKTDSLWPGIILHALKNGLAFVTLYIIGTH